jgi:ABC-type multidrug transport system permease subunit
MLSDIPNKVILTVAVNTPYYFLANLRRTPDAFFTYLLFSFAMLLTGSMIWRADGAKSRTLSESMPIGAGFSTLLTLYTGFVIPIPYMRPWLRWFAYINPSAYAFESLLINEVTISPGISKFRLTGFGQFSGRQFPCSKFVPEGPDYDDATPFQRTCTVFGTEDGSSLVNGDRYLATNFDYYPQHKWRYDDAQK